MGVPANLKTLLVHSVYFGIVARLASWSMDTCIKSSLEVGELFGDGLRGTPFGCGLDRPTAILSFNVWVQANTNPRQLCLRISDGTGHRGFVICGAFWC